MLEQLLVWERDAFFMLNGSDSAFLDRFMWIYSGKAVWLPLAFFILVVLCYKKNWKEWLLILLAIVLTITLCDQFASHVCKPIFTRFRPTHHPDFMDQVKVVFGYRGGMYGFISSHAANAFGFATLMALIFRNKLFGWTIFFLGDFDFLYSYLFRSAFYHGYYSGSFIRSAIRVSCISVIPLIRPKLIPADSWVRPEAIYSDTRKRLITYAIWLTILLIALFNEQLVSCLI